MSETMSEDILPIETSKEMKAAVIARISRMEDGNTTHKLMLHILRVFDNPSILKADMGYLESLEELRRQARLAKTKVIWWFMSLIGLIGSVILNLISQFVPK